MPSTALAALVTIDATVEITGANANLITNQSATTGFDALWGTGIGDTYTITLTFDQDAPLFTSVSDTTVTDGRVETVYLDGALVPGGGLSGAITLPGLQLDLINTTTRVSDNSATSSPTGPYDLVTIDTTYQSPTAFAGATTNFGGSLREYTSISAGRTSRLSWNDSGATGGDLFTGTDQIAALTSFGGATNQRAQIDFRLTTETGSFLDLRLSGTITDYSVTVSEPPAIPLPASLPLLAVGLGGLALLNRRVRRV